MDTFTLCFVLIGISTVTTNLMKFIFYLNEPHSRPRRSRAH